MPLNKSQITSKINTDLPTNANNEISAEDLRGVLVEFNNSSANLITDEPLLGLSQWSNARAYSSGKGVIKDNAIYQAIVSVTTVGTFVPSEWQQISSYFASTSGLNSYLLKDNGIELDNGKLLRTVATDTAISGLNTGFYKVESVTVGAGLSEEYPELGKATLAVLKRASQSESLLYFYPHNNLTHYYIKKSSDSVWTEFKSGTTYTIGAGLTNSSNTVYLGGTFEAVVLTGHDNNYASFNINNANGINLGASNIYVTGTTSITGDTTITGDINLGTVNSNIQTSSNDLNLNAHNINVNGELHVTGNSEFDNVASYPTNPFTATPITDNQIPNWKVVEAYVDTKLTNKILNATYVNGLFGESSTNGTGGTVNSVGLGRTPLTENTTIETKGFDFKINNNSKDSNITIGNSNITVTAKNGSGSNVRTVQTNSYNNYKVEVFNSSNVVTNKIELDTTSTKIKGDVYLLGVATGDAGTNSKILTINHVTKQIFETDINTIVSRPNFDFTQNNKMVITSGNTIVQNDLVGYNSTSHSLELLTVNNSISPRLDFKNSALNLSSTIEKKYFSDWIENDYSTISWVFDVFFVDDNIGYMCSSDNNYSDKVIKKTIDGGDTWNNIHTLTFTPKQMFFFGDIGYVFGDKSNALYFVKTSDGGSTWSSEIAIGHDTYVIKSIHFKDANTGIIVGRQMSPIYGFYAKTVDGGSTWNITTISTTGMLRSLSYVGANTLYTYFYKNTTSQHIIYKSTDYGDTWTENPISGLIGTINSIDEIKIFSSLDIYIIGRKTSPVLGGFFAKTNNGGYSWTEVNIPSNSVNQIIANDSQNLYVLGYDFDYQAILLKSNDYGDTWNLRTYPNMSEFTDGWIFSNSEKILLYGSDYDYNFVIEQKSITSGEERNTFVVYKNSDFNNKEIISNIAVPKLKSDVANKEYVDSIVTATDIASFNSKGTYSVLSKAHFPGLYNNVLKSVDASNPSIYTEQSQNSNFYQVIANYNDNVAYQTLNYLGWNVGMGSNNFGFGLNGLYLFTGVHAPAYIKADNLTLTQTYQLPDSSGTLLNESYLKFDSTATTFIGDRDIQTVVNTNYIDDEFGPSAFAVKASSSTFDSWIRVKDESVYMVSEFGSNNSNIQVSVMGASMYTNFMGNQAKIELGVSDTYIQAISNLNFNCGSGSSINFGGDVSINSLGYLQLPSGGTSDRPSYTNAGMIRFNIDINKAECYDGTAWQPLW